MAYRSVRWVPPGYGGAIPRLEIDGVLHSRMFEIGDAADVACGDVMSAGKHPISYHVMKLYRQQNPGMCKMIERSRAKQWGWYVPVVAELAVERFAMNPLNRKTAKGSMFAAMNWAKKQKRLKELGIELPEVSQTPIVVAPPKLVRVVATGIDWADHFGRKFRGYDVNLPVGKIVALRGPDQFIRIRDFVEATGRNDAVLRSMITDKFANKVIAVHPLNGQVRSSNFLHHSAISDCLSLIERRSRRNKEGITELRNLLGVAA